MKEAIVTGANGFIGRHLVKTLLEENYTVWAIIRPNGGCNIRNIVGINVVECDMKDIDRLPFLMKIKYPEECVFFHNIFYTDLFHPETCEV